MVLEADEKSWCTLTAEANNKVLGKRLGKALAGVKKALAKLDTAALWPLLEVRTVSGQALDNRPGSSIQSNKSVPWFTLVLTLELGSRSR